MGTVCGIITAMKKKPTRRVHQELTPETLSQMDQATLIALMMKVLEQNKVLSEQLQSVLQERYGKKTERPDNPEQLRIFECDTAQEEAISANVDPVSNETEKQKKRPGHARNPMPSRLKHKRIERTPSPQEVECRCGGHRVKVGEVIRNSRYECEPVNVFVEDIIDSIWECSNCHDRKTIEADACEPILGGTAGPQLLVGIVENRWLNHLPLHRQEQMFARLGADIPRSTMCGWSAEIARIFEPVYDCMKAELLLSKAIATDDTPVKVQDRTKKANIARGHEWIFIGDDDHPMNLFHHTRGRGRDGPLRFLAGFKGFLQGDCFSGNRALCAETGATHVACRAHDRRYYVKARPNNKKLCDEMLVMYSALFEIEKTGRELELSADQMRLLRHQESVPLLAKMKAWIDEHSVTALPSSSLGKALAYSRNNWEQLNNYLLDGDLRIDNNLAEQQMKMFATGRKNWYFFGSEEAGMQASIMLSLLSTCLRNRLEPRSYLYDVLLRLIENPDCDKTELLPHRWSKKYEMGEIRMSNLPQKVETAYR